MSMKNDILRITAAALGLSVVACGGAQAATDEGTETAEQPVTETGCQGETACNSAEAGCPSEGGCPSEECEGGCPSEGSGSCEGGCPSEGSGSCEGGCGEGGCPSEAPAGE